MIPCHLVWNSIWDRLRMTGDRRIRADLLFPQAAVHEVQHSCLPLLREWICLDSYPAPTKAVIILKRIPQQQMPPSVSMSVIDSCVLGRPGGSWQYAPCSWPRHCCGAASLQIVIAATWTSFGDQLVELSVYHSGITREAFNRMEGLPVSYRLTYQP